MTYRVAVLDTETTGLDVMAGHQIIEVAIAIFSSNDRVSFTKLGDTWVQRIKPTVAIDPGSQAVHGIDLKDLRGEPTWDVVAPKVHKLLGMCDVVVAHNAEFDMAFLAVELNRAKLPLPDIQVFCTIENGIGTTALGKKPNLRELCWAFGIDYDEDAAHAADYDVDVLSAALFEGVRRGRFVLPLNNEAKEAA